MDSLTSLVQIPTEILFEIFGYLSCTDVLYTFFHYSERLNSILLQHQRFSRTFVSPTANFYFWENILLNIRTYVRHLSIITVDFYFSWKLFPNLQYLIISSPFSVDYGQLYSIFESPQFHDQNSFVVHLLHFYRTQINYNKISIAVYEIWF